MTPSGKPTTDVMVYGACKTAFKSGGFSKSAINSSLVTNNPSADLAFNPQSGRGFEAGIRIGAQNDRSQRAVIGKNLTNTFSFIGATHRADAADVEVLMRGGEGQRGALRV